MKKNLILFIVMTLVLVSLVSALSLPSWMGGKAIDSDLASRDALAVQEKTQVRQLGNEDVLPIGEGQITMVEGEIYTLNELSGQQFIISVLEINNDQVVFDVDGTMGEINAGSLAVIGGLEINVIDVFESWWRRSYVVLEVEVVSGDDSGIGTPIPSTYDEIFTLVEGTTAITEAGDDVSIGYISASEAILVINGENTNALAEGETQLLRNISWTILDVMYDARDGGLSQVEIGYRLATDDGGGPGPGIPFGEVTYAGILNMLSSCTIYTYENVDLDGDGRTTGNEVCQSHGKTCILTESFFDSLGSSNWTVDQYTLADWHSTLSPCYINNDYSVMRTVCCSVPLEDTSAQITGGSWGCIPCSSPGQCGSSQCLSSGCCGGTAPTGVTNQAN